MSEVGNPSDMNTPDSFERAQRRRVAWLGSLANLTIASILVALWLLRTLPIEMVGVLALIVVPVVNGALWLGLRIQLARRGVGRPFGPLALFAVGSFVAIDAAIEILSRNYGSAGMLLIGSVSVVLLGLITIKRKRKGERP